MKPPTYRVEDQGFTTPCWIWDRQLQKNGYGVIMRNKRRQYAHRYFYETFQGAIPEGLEIDHLCRVRACVNPDHLEPVTRQENVKRGLIGKRTHCPHGHAYDEANTYVSARGHRYCRRCRREGMKRAAERKRLMLIFSPRGHGV